MTEHTLGPDSGPYLGSVGPAPMDEEIRQEIANEMRALAAAMFGLRFEDEAEPETPPAAQDAVPGLGVAPGEVDVLGGEVADFDFDQDLGPARDDDPEDRDDGHSAGDSEPSVPEPSRWATHEEPTIHNARTRAMLEEIAFLDE